MDVVLQVTGLIPAFQHTLSILRAISTVLLMDAANDYLSVLRTSTGEVRRDSAVFFAGNGQSLAIDHVALFKPHLMGHLLQGQPLMIVQSCHPGLLRKSDTCDHLCKPSALRLISHS